MKRLKQIFAVILALAVLMSAVPFSTILVSAEETIDYLNINAGEIKTAEITIAGEDAYFCFIPAHTESYTFYSMGDMDTFGYLYDGDMNLLSSNDDDGDGSNFSITYTMYEGKTYFLGAKYWSVNQVGSFEVALQANHFGEIKAITKEATCTETGEEVYSCTACGQEYIEIIPTIEHNFVGSICTACGRELGGTCGDNTTWKLDEFGTLTISGTGNMDWWESYDSNPWYSYSDSIVTVIIEDGVTNIGNYAFYDCGNLKSITIPNGVTTIGSEAFHGCTNLTNITIPEGVTEIGWGAFRYCSELTSISIPASVTTISTDAFYGCSSLTDIYFGLGLAPWFSDSDIFGGVTATVYYPKGNLSWTAEKMKNYGGTITWKSYEIAPFTGICNNGFSWLIEDGTLTITGRGDMEDFDHVYSSDVGANIAPWYLYNSYFTNVILSDGITSIGANAFEYCSNLTGITIPNGVTTIGSAAFNDCSELTSIILPEGVTEIGSNAFAWCNSLTNITIPDSVHMIGDGAFLYCSNLINIIIPEGVTIIAPSTFENCSSFTSIVIPTSVTTIGSKAFYGCTNLTNITIPDGVIEIGWNAFACCSGLTSISVDEDNPVFHSEGNCLIETQSKILITGCQNSVIPDNNVTSIASNAFLGCSGLIGVIIPDSVTKIDSGAFKYCDGLTSITIPAGVTDINGSAFANCSGLREITFLGSAPWISLSAFDSVTALAYYPEGDSSWNEDTLQNYNSTAYGRLTWIPYDSVSGPEYATIILDSGTCGNSLRWTLDSEGTLTISGIGDMTDYNYNYDIPWHTYRYAIQTVVLEEGVTSIGAYAFTECENLADAIIPSSVESIGSYAFDQSGITTVVIPDGVTWIGERTFGFCDKLTSITIPEGVTDIGNYAFYDCTALNSVTIPDSVVDIDWNAFYNCTSLESIVLPDGVEVSSEAFAYCTGLKSITVGPYYSTYISDDAFSGVTATIYYPDGNLEWQEKMEQGYEGTLTWVPYELKDAGGTLENGMTWTMNDGVLTITGTGNMPDFAYVDYDYYNNADLCTTAPWSIYRNYIREIVVSEGIQSVGDYAFMDLPYLDSCDLPGTVVSLNDYAFSWCGTLTDITLPEGLLSIGNYTFSGLDNVSDWVIPEGVTTIGDYAFASTTLNSISFPSTLKTVGEGAFEWGGAHNVYVPDMETWMEIQFDTFFSTPFLEFGSSTLYVGGELVTDVVIPYGVTEIKNAQFWNYKRLNSVMIPDSVTQIGEEAFYWSGIRNIIIPASVEVIERDAFNSPYSKKRDKIVILNPDCILDPNMYTVNLDDWEYGFIATIYGFAGSTAEQYAADHNLVFVALAEYEVIEGADSILKSGETLEIRVNGEFSKFESVAVDGLTVDPANYTVSEGSTIVTFNAEYLATLDAREHSVTVFFADGVAATTLTVPECMMGDINSDGVVNAKDVANLRRYLAGGWDVTIDEVAADVNGDNTINAKDVANLRRYLAGGWDVTLG